MRRIRVNVLGEFELWSDGQRLRLPTRHAEIIVALLALTPGRVHSRERLSALFWPGRDEEQARTSLRQAVYQIRRTLGDAKDSLEADARFVGLNPESFDSDVAELLGVGEVPVETLWRGDFLAGHDSREEALEAWLLEERARLRSIALEKGQGRAAALLDRHRFVEAEAVARRCMAIDAYDEASCRFVMTACAGQGRRNAAIAFYRDLEERLRSDLSAKPENATTELYRSIRSREDTGRRNSPPKPAPEPAQPEPLPEPVAELPVEVPQPAPVPETPQAERRLATALNLRLYAPSLDIDPELAQELDTGWFNAMAMIVTRHSGRVIHADAASLTACFGLSGMAEDHAINAGKAAVELLAVSPGAAIAAHSGLVVATAQPDSSFVGPVAMTARALSLVAPADSVFFSKAARVGAEGWFHFTDLPPVALPGLSAPLGVSRLDGPTDARNRWDVQARRSLSPFQGRTMERAMLDDLLERSASHAQIALVSGLPGIGKTRLVHEFLKGLPADARVVRLGLASHDVEITYRLPELLVEEWLAARPEAAGALLSGNLPEKVRLGLSMLTNDASVAAELNRISPGQQAHCIVEAMGHILSDLAEGGRLVLVLEDLHWIDNASREVLTALVETLGASPVLMVGTTRPEFQPGWANRSHVRMLPLDELRQAQAEALVASHVGDAPELAELRRELASHAGRIPLFIEEVVRELRAKGDLAAGYDGQTLVRPLEALDVPITVRGVIAARIDRLDPGPRALLQAFSVLGAEVAEADLKSLSGLEDAAFWDALQVLSSAEMLYHGRRAGMWNIRHALVRDVVYQSILRNTRKALHQRAVEVLTPPDRTAAEAMAGTLARHAVLGELWPEAARYSRIAGDRAHDLSIFAAARRHYIDAISALAHMPASDDVLRTGVETRLRLRPALMLLGERQELERMLTEAEEMAGQLGDAYLLGRVLVHRSYAESTLGLVEEALVSGARGSEQAELCGNDYLAAEARLARGQALRVQCRAAEAIDILEPDLDFWVRRNPLERADHLGTRSVWYLGHLGAVYALSGRFDEAIACIDDAVRIAEDAARPADRQHAYFSRAEIHMLAGDLVQAQEDADRADAIFRASTIWRTGTQAEILLAAGETERAMTMLRRVEDRARELGQEHVLNSQVTVALAEGELIQGKTDAARARAEALLPAIKALNLRRHELRLRVVLARAALQAGNADEAAGEARAAIAIAASCGLEPDAARIETLLAEIGQVGGNRLSA